MNLLGLQLQRSGLSFVSAKARHTAGGIRIDEIVCATVDDCAAVDAWAAREGYPVTSRLATAEEIALTNEVPW